MKALNIFPEDFDRFENNVDREGCNFFNDHVSLFKKMWIEQGSTFWLRFLISFKSFFTKHYSPNFDPLGRLDHRDKKHLLETIFIYIHKNFVEGDDNAACNFISNIFIMEENCGLTPGLLSSAIVNDPFTSETCKSIFKFYLNVFTVPDNYVKFPAISAFIMYQTNTKFCSAVCSLLKKFEKVYDWVCENDDDNKCVYWAPCPEWTSKTFIPSLFDKYILEYWKDKLPKMLLTCDIQNIFSKEVIPGGSNNKNENTNSTDSETFKSEKMHFLESFYKPRYEFVLCKLHRNCRIKIEHSIECIEPHFCEGGPKCSVTCETDCNKKLNFKSPLEEGDNFWKYFEAIESECTGKNRRDVTTSAKPFNSIIATFRFEKKVTQVLPKPVFSNCHFWDCEIFKQLQQRQETKKRLRNKLSKKIKNYSDSEWDGTTICHDQKAFEDSKYRLVLIEKAKARLDKELQSTKATNSDCIREHIAIFCSSWSSEVKYKNDRKKQSSTKQENEIKLVNKMQIINSVAVGTDDVVSGKVFMFSLKPTDINTDLNHAHITEDNKNRTSEDISEKDSSKSGLSTNIEKNNSETNTALEYSTCYSDINLIHEIDSTKKKCSKCTKGLNSTASIWHSKNVCDGPGDIALCREHMISKNALITAFSFASKNCKKTKEISVTASVECKTKLKIFSMEKECGESSKPNSPKTNISRKGKSKSKLPESPTKNDPKSIMMNDKSDNAGEETTLKSEFETITDMNKKTENMNGKAEQSDEISTLPSASICDIESVEKELLDFFFSIDEEDKPDTTVHASKSASQKSNNIRDKVNGANAKHEDSKPVPETGNMVDCVLKGSDKSLTNNDVDSESSKFKTCAYCQKKETHRKSFKKCSRCKSENFPKHNYYCSRQCQVEDWTNSHKYEHEKNIHSNNK